MSGLRREYTTPEAHELFGSSRLAYRTAVRRAQLVFREGGDKRIRLIGGSFVAPEDFWRELFARPARRGRPPKVADGPAGAD